MSKVWDIPLQIGGPKTTFFEQLRNLTVTLTAYVFETKLDIHCRQSVRCVDNYKGSSTQSQNVMNFGRQTP